MRSVLERYVLRVVVFLLANVHLRAYSITACVYNLKSYSPLFSLSLSLSLSLFLSISFPPLSPFLHPHQAIPQWANTHTLTSFMLDQEAALEANCINVAEIFPPEQLLKDIDLARIFKFKRKRFFQRSSSAHWNSPLYKKNRFEI